MQRRYRQKVQERKAAAASVAAAPSIDVSNVATPAITPVVKPLPIPVTTPIEFNP